MGNSDESGNCYFSVRVLRPKRQPIKMSKMNGILQTSDWRLLILAACPSLCMVLYLSTSFRSWSTVINRGLPLFFVFCVECKSSFDLYNWRLDNSLNRINSAFENFFWDKRYWANRYFDHFFLDIYFFRNLQYNRNLLPFKELVGCTMSKCFYVGLIISPIITLTLAFLYISYWSICKPSRREATRTELENVFPVDWIKHFIHKNAIKKHAARTGKRKWTEP